MTRPLQGFYITEYGFFLVSQVEENGIKRGSLLVTLAIRSKETDSIRSGRGFVILLFSLPSAIRLICHSVSAPYGNVQGLLAPSTLGRDGTPLHPEERKAFLIRLRRLAITGIIPCAAFLQLRNP